MVSVVLLSFRRVTLSFSLEPVSIHKMLWKMFREFDSIFFAAVAIPAHNVVRSELGFGVVDDLLYTIRLRFLAVPWFVRGLTICWFRFDSPY